ncbi:TPA: hypothetical protein ACH3X1_006178 [Trebouxia sp. C0004]
MHVVQEASTHLYLVHPTCLCGAAPLPSVWSANCPAVLLCCFLCKSELSHYLHIVSIPAMAHTLYSYDCSLIAAVIVTSTVSSCVLQQLKAINIGMQSTVAACASSGLMRSMHVARISMMCMHNDNPERSIYIESVICRLVMGQHWRTQSLLLGTLSSMDFQLRYFDGGFVMNKNGLY